MEYKTIHKRELVGRQARSRLTACTSKTSLIESQLGKRDGHWFYAPTAEQLNADLNASWNLAQWDGFSCSVDLKREAVVMVSSDSENVVFGSPLSSIKVLVGEQLCLCELDGRIPCASKRGSVRMEDCIYLSHGKNRRY